jgi:hypothetical protein
VRTKEQKDRFGYLLIGSSLAVVLLLAVLGLTVLRTDRIDPKTGCPMNHKAPAAHSVVLVDETDALSRDELAYAKAVILNEYYWLPIGGRMTVRNIIAEPDLAEDIVVCRMDDGSKALGLASNPRMLRASFQKVAGARLDDLYTALRKAPLQKMSPIMEYVAATMDRPNFGSDVKDRRLVVISDMAQHSDLFSQYGHDRHPRPTDDAMEQLRRDLTDVHVRIHYVPRRSLAKLQGPAHRAFWIDYFKHMHADTALGHSLLIGEDPQRETWTDDH